MTTALLEAPVPRVSDIAGPARPTGGRVTLEERLRETWKTLHENGPAECPACGSRMVLHDAAGRCEACGSRLD